MTELLRVVDELATTHRAIPLGQVNGQHVFASQNHTVSVVGQAQSGKSSGVFIPAVAVHPGPVVVTSLRPDVRDATFKARTQVSAHYGGGVYELVVDEAIPQLQGLKRVHWDLASGCEIWNTAQDRAMSLLSATLTGRDDGHWRDTGQKLLAASLFAGRRVGLTDRQIRQKLDLRDMDDLLGYLEFYAETDADSEDAYAALASVVSEGSTAADERASIFSTVTSRALGALRYTRPDESTELDPKGFLSSWGTLYITVRLERAQHVAPWIACLVEMLTSTWRALRRQTGEPTLLLALDEVANVAPARSVPSLITAGGGDGMQSLLGFQDPDQANRWPEQHNVLLNGTSHSVLFPGLMHPEYLSRLSSVLGKSIAYDVHVEVASDLPQGPRYASSGRLIAERGQLEAALAAYAGRRNRLASAAALLEATRIWAQRIRTGIEPRLGQVFGAEAVLGELLQFTRVTHRSERRDQVETADLFRGKGPRTVIVRSGTQVEFRELPRHYEDPTWKSVLS